MVERAARIRLVMTEHGASGPGFAARGRGLGRRLLEIAGARERGGRQIYLETRESTRAACALHENLGFARLPGMLGATGHVGCDRQDALAL